MKRILTASISSTAKQPLIKGSLEFLQDSYKEVINALVNGLITYTTNDVIIIYGCVVSGSNPYAVTAGAIYYNGEIYLVDAASGLAPGGGQTIVWDIVETFDAIDPVTFSDLSTHSVHQISKIALIVGASGSGIADYNEATVNRYKDSIASGFSVNASSNLTSPAIFASRATKQGSQVNYAIIVTGTTVLAAGYTWTLDCPDGFKMKQSIGGAGANIVMGILTRRVSTVEVTNLADIGTSDVYCYIDSNNRLVIGDSSIGATTATEFILNITGESI